MPSFNRHDRVEPHTGTHPHAGERGVVEKVTAAGVEVEWDDGDVTVEPPDAIDHAEPTERELA
jgi:hypothetical protein